MGDAPEFNTKTLSPLSPQPLHPTSEPSKISVLRDQPDTFFDNMTDIEPPSVALPDPAPPSAIVHDDDDDSCSASSFSSAYKEQPQQAHNVVPTEDVANEETDDDYDMAVDTDEEEQLRTHAVSQPTAEQESNLLSPSSSKVPLFNVQDEPIQTESSKQAPSPSPPSATAAPTQPSASTQAGAEDSQPRTHTYEQIASGEVDIQALLDNITANAEKHEALKNEKSPPASTPTSATMPTYSLPPRPSVGVPPHHISLPPRPQAPAGANMNDDELSKHHPAQVQGQSQSQQPAQNIPTPHNTYRPPPGVNVPYVAAAPGTISIGRGELPPPPGISKGEPPFFAGVYYPPPPGVADYGLHGTVNPIFPSGGDFHGSYHEQERPSSAVSSNNPSDGKWPLSIQHKYDAFLGEERKFIADQSWDSFPAGSRLFIGNLNGGSVTKRDIFHVFHHHGRIAQIAVKPAYGFVQFHDNESCLRAVREEQGTVVRGNPMQLQVSKANKTKNKTAAPRRSGSPDNLKGGMPNRNGKRGRDVPVRDEYNRPSSDSHTRRRSPSPPRGHLRGRDSYSSRGRGGDFYDGRDRQRSRSRSPFREQSSGYRNRSPSPRRDEWHPVESKRDDDPIRRRDPSDVPDIQIYLTCALDRDFISWIEGELRARGLKTDVMMYNHRLPEDYLIRRQVLDGVHAVSKLGMSSQSKSKMSVKVFERKAEGEEVSFNDYDDLDPHVVAELVVLAKKRSEDAKAAQLSNQYRGIPPHTQYATPQAYQPPAAQNYQQNYQHSQHSQPYQPNPAQYQPTPTGVAASDIGNLVNQLDNDALQKLLSSLTAQPQPQNVPAAAANASIDLASILGGIQKQTQQYQPQPIPATYAPPANGQYNGTSLAQPSYEGQEAVHQVQNIMAQLAKYRQ